MSLGIAIFLCDITGVMAKPWVEAGYDVILVDPQHPEGVTVDGQTTKVGYIINHPETWRVLREAIQTDRVAFVVGFPPCTDVAVSGTPQFARKFAADKHYQAKAALVAEQCRTVGQLSGARWFFENPVSVFSSIFGKPNSIFSPWQFTGICVNDNYFKTTCLWTGNGFAMPSLCIHPDVACATDIVFRIFGRLPADKKKMLKENADKFTDEERSIVEEFYPDDRIHKASPGANRANFRSATPEGFSRATYLANAPHLNAANSNEPAGGEV